jgi:PAS domain S-box-containing protein
VRTDADASTAARTTIVFADNDRLLLDAMGEFLRSKGYDVHGAEDGLAAWRLIRQLRPTYVILDVVMPKLDGSRVSALVRQDPTLRATPIIVFSALAAPDFRHFPNLSADAYVAKGEFTSASQHLVQALAHLQTKGRTDLAGAILGYDAMRPREIVAEMLLEMRRYASLLRALGPGTMELDADGRILRLSPGACKILGRSESELLGEHVASLCPARDQETLRDLLRELATAAQPARCRAVVRFGDPEIPVQLCAIVEDGRYTGTLLILESPGTSADAPGAQRQGHS